MRLLRACGFTNEQISRITSQRWKTGVVKNATAGTPVSSPDIGQRTMNILVQVVQSGRTIPDLEQAFNVAKTVEPSQVTEIVAFLEELKKSGVKLDQFFKDYSQMKQDNLTPQNLNTAITYKNHLETAGFNLQSLTQLKSLADKYGNPTIIFTALESYTNLTQIIKDLKSKKAEHEDTKKLLEVANAQLKKHQDLEKLSNSLAENYTQLQEALTKGTMNVAKDLADQLQTITGSFEKETKQKISNLSTTYSEEVQNQLKNISTTISNLTAPVEKSTKELVKTIDDGIKSADALKEGYGSLQQTLQSCIDDLPGQLGTELHKITDAFQNQTEEALSQTRRDFTTATTKNLEDINSSLSSLRKQLDQNNESFSKSVNEAVSKATSAITTLATLAADTVDKDQNRYRQSLESIQLETVKRIDEVKQALDKGEEAIMDAMDKTILAATKNVEELSKRAVEAGAKFKEVELRYAESKPYMDLVELVRNPASATPPVLATVTTVVKAFLEWLETKPPSISQSYTLSESGNVLLRYMQDEIPTI